MKTTYSVLTLTLALTALAAPQPEPVALPEPQAPPAAPAEPAGFAPVAAPAPARFVRGAQVAQVGPKGDLFLSRGRSGRTLIIQTSEADPKAYANLEEDLNVMYRILTKTRKQ